MKKTFLFFGILYTASAVANPKLPKNYYWSKLDNGLEVVVIENHKVPLATIEIAVKNGSYTESPEYSGLSHLFEHMFFKANKDYPTQEKFILRLNELGAIWNGTTDKEKVNYFITVVKDSLNAGLQFMNTAIRYPIYRQEDMVKERPVVDGEFQRKENRPDFQLWYSVAKRVWGDLYNRKNSIGDHNIINTATPEKMMVIKNKYYHPNNSLLIVCGDVEHAIVLEQIKNVFSNWPHSGFNPQEKYPIPEFAPIKQTEYFVQESPIAQSPYILFEWQGPDTRNDSAATIAADVFSTIVSLNASKWQQALIDKGLATYAYIGYETSKYVGPIYLAVYPNANKLKECYEAIKYQLSIINSSDYFTEEQLSDAKQVFKRDKIRREEKPSSLAGELSTSWCSTSYAYMSDYLDNCMKVTKEDIQKYINTYIAGKPYIAGMLIHPETNKIAKAADFFKANN